MAPYEIEPSVQMRLYTLTKGQFFVVFFTFCMCYIITVIIGLAGPHKIDSLQQNATALTPLPQLPEGPYTLETPTLSAFEQQLWLITEVTATVEGDGRVVQPTTIGVLIRSLEEDEAVATAEDYGPEHNRTRDISCTPQGCSPLLLLHLPYLVTPRYVITVTFYGLTNLKAKVTDVKFYFKMYNSSFTQLEIWIRFILVGLTFITTCWFSHSLHRFSIRDWSMEQKWISLLLPLLLLYNNPFFPLIFLSPSWLPAFLDVVLQATFLCALLLCWVCLYHGVRQTKRSCLVFYLPKLLLVGLIWLTAVLLASWQGLHESRDPTYNYKLDTGKFMGLKIFFFILGALYLTYLLYHLVRAYAELRHMPYFDLRLKFMTGLMLVVLAITSAIFVLRFGVAFLQENFVADLSTSYNNAVEFMSFYGLLNLYLYTMAYVYSPAKNAAFESHFRDNPALSMLNDSDDDVIYGSDREEPVNRSRLPNGRVHDDSEDDL